VASVELVLLKQVAGYLVMPVFLVDPEGDLIYYNEPAEALLGYRYEETGEMPLGEWGTLFHPTDSHGQPIPADQLPLAVACQELRPVQGSFWIRGMDGVSRHLAVTALPLQGEGGVMLGAMALFWQLNGSGSNL
jgi:PAS domain-containing protein